MDASTSSTANIRYILAPTTAVEGGRQGSLISPNEERKARLVRDLTQAHVIETARHCNITFYALPMTLWETLLARIAYIFVKAISCIFTEWQERADEYRELRWLGYTITYPSPPSAAPLPPLASTPAPAPAPGKRHKYAINNDIYAAVNAGNVEFIIALLREGGDLNGEGLLHNAAAGGHPSTVRYLLDQGLPVNQANLSDNTTPLHFAAMYNRTAVIEELLSRGASLDAITTKGYTPLHTAAKHGAVGSVIVLLKSKARIDAKDKEGKTPLHHAAAYGFSQIANLLGRDETLVNAQDNDGNTALHLAVQCHRPAEACTTAEVLLKFKANLQLKNNKGETPVALSCLAPQANELLTPLLLEKLAVENPEEAKRLATLALFNAIEKGFSLSFIEKIVKAGADVASTDKSGKTPLQYAMLKSDPKIVTFLLQQLKEASGSETETSMATNLLNEFIPTACPLKNIQALAEHIIAVNAHQRDHLLSLMKISLIHFALGHNRFDIAEYFSGLVIDNKYADKGFITLIENQLTQLLLREDRTEKTSAVEPSTELISFYMQVLKKAYGTNPEFAASGIKLLGTAMERGRKASVIICILDALPTLTKETLTTLLRHAIDCWNLDAARVLIEKGADPLVKDEVTATEFGILNPAPKIWALVCSSLLNIAERKALLMVIIDVVTKEMRADIKKYFLNKALMELLGLGCQTEIIETLLELGADPNSKQSDRSFGMPYHHHALHVAARNQDPKTVLALCKKGANTSLKDSGENTPYKLWILALDKSKKDDPDFKAATEALAPGAIVS